MGGDGTGGDVNHRRRKLARNLVHVGQHQEQTLTGGERRRERAARRRAVQRARRARFRLHLDDLGNRAPTVGRVLSREHVGQFSHGRCRRDRIQRDHVGERVADPCRGLIAIDDPVRHATDARRRERSSIGASDSFRGALRSSPDQAVECRVSKDTDSDRQGDRSDGAVGQVPRPLQREAGNL